jgi:arginine/lysine/ornithine decarboxylase
LSIQASDPNNNNVFVTNSQQQQQQQQSALLGLQQTVTQTPTVQTNKSISNVLPSLTPQQLNQFQVQQQQQQQQQIHMQQQNNVQSYNTTQLRVRTNNLDPVVYFTFY